MEQDLVRDVVCGMTIDKANAAGSVEHDGNWYYFCSEHCKMKFESAPENYTQKAD